ncbi:MAG: hypothetical protein AB1Z67_13800 [Candidatus Limnocylindrales bacterium]
MARPRLGGALGLALALTVSAATAAEEPDTPPPLLEALAFVSSASMPASLDFIDWGQLRELHGGAGVTGDSPLAERQRLMLAIAGAEAATMPFGFDRLAAWRETWGWANADLAWEARVYGEFAVMRFAGHWDASEFGAALKGFGYTAHPTAGGALYEPDPAADVPWQLRFANMHGLDIHGQAITEPMVWVAVDEAARTVVFGRSAVAGSVLREGLAANPDEVAERGFGRAASALGRPLTASILDGRVACSETTMGWLEGAARQAAASVAPLHRYEALAAGYSRAGAGAAPEGRFVFAYRDPVQALEDLAGRQVLVEEGNPFNDNFSRYDEAAFGLSAAWVAGSRLILDVAPVNDEPVHVMRQVRTSPILFATCGPMPGSV